MALETNGSIINVRSIISLFENKTTPQRGRLSSSKSFSRSHAELQKSSYIDETGNYDFGHQDLIDIEKHLRDLEHDLREYQFYSKEDHTYFQTELVTILSEIVNVEGKDDRIPGKKKELILAVRNCNVILTKKLPGDNAQVDGGKYSTQKIHLVTDSKNIQVHSNKNTRQIYRYEVDEEIKKISPSVKKLKSIFEQKCTTSETNGGLNSISEDERNSNLKRAMSFGGISCSYVAYKDREDKKKNTEDDYKYTVEGVNLKNERVVHNTGLKRHNRKRRSNPKMPSGGIKKTVPSTEEDRRETTPENTGHEEETTSVFDLVNRIERKLSIDSNNNSFNSNISNSTEDIDRKFNEVFEELEDDNVQESNVNAAQYVMLCEPVQRAPSESSAVEETSEVNVQKLVRNIENNADTPRVSILRRSLSKTMQNALLDSNSSDSSSNSTEDTVVDTSEKVMPQSYSEVAAIQHKEKHINLTNGNGYDDE